jgi:hypothetical protein
VERVRGKLWWSNVAVGILPGAFSISDARTVYEAIARTAYTPRPSRGTSRPPA